MLLNSKEIFFRLMELYKITKMNEFSVHIGYKESWGAATRKREGIPYDACVKASIEHGVSMDYLLFGTTSEEKNVDANDLKVAVTEGIFTLIQLKMMEPAEGVKISTMATAITDEIITSCDIENKAEPKKVV